jgi:hypothetical protein
MDLEKPIVLLEFISFFYDSTMFQRPIEDLSAKSTQVSKYVVKENRCYSDKHLLK